MGYEVTLGEATRSPATAKFYAEQGIGIESSLHRIRLALDINLFKNGEYLLRTEDYRPLGEWWESQAVEDIKFVWGGRFEDGDHFSFEHQGIR